MALKRGGGKANAALDENWMVAAAAERADEAYEAAIFRSKVEAAIRKVEKQCDFTDFSIYQMRVFDGLSGKEVAAQVGVSEPTVSRRLAKVRDMLRSALAEVVATYSFTEEEYREAERNGLILNPNSSGDKPDDALFDEAIGEIYHRQMELRRMDETGLA